MSRAGAQSVVIAQGVAAFFGRGNSLLVATRDATLHPHVTRASGIRVVDRRHVEVLVPVATSKRTFANLKDNPAIAVCACSPIDFEAYQVKGHFLDVHDATPEDIELCHEQMRAFAEAAARFGNTRAQVRNLWLFECRRISLRVTEVYAQTPGPGAGRPHVGT